MKKFKFIEHTADVKFLAFGRSVEEAFENAALATKQTICDNVKVVSKKKKIINLKQKDLESLLYSFLEEILYLLDAENFLLAEVSKITIDKKLNLKATLIGDNASDYEFTNSVKAVTYNDMSIKKEIVDNKRKKEFWTIQVVLDV